ncbi:MAG: discoidin domain-containing protein [Deltaproteobacteria bacterium]|nr:discoidin domain-containing protein [Deltaproteobacteria bacterium]
MVKLKDIKLKHIVESLVYALILALPFFMLAWLIPFRSEITIGNDYGVFPLQQQMELNFSQEKGTFPLYSPGFAKGRSQAALTMGQLFHPASHLSRHTPGYWEGNALTINTLYRFIGLGLAHLLLFIFLRRMKFHIGPALLLSVITVYNMRMLDLFRYGASLENYTGYIVLCASLGFLFIEKNIIAAAIAVAISAWLLIVGGHPQMMYLGLLGAGVFAIVLPFCAAAIRLDLKSRISKRYLIQYYLAAGIAVAVGLLLAAPYVFSFYGEFVSENAMRVGQDYQWSLIFTDTVGGVFNNIFAPLDTDVHGAFGSSSIILLVPMILLAILSGIRVPLGIVAAVLCSILIFLSCMGEATPIHYWFWKYVPLAQTFRTPGRNGMMLPALTMISLAWLFAPVDKDRFFKFEKLPFNRMILPALAAVAMYLIYQQFVFPELSYPRRYCPEMIIADKMKDLALLSEMKDVAMPRIQWLGLITLVLAALWSVRIPWKPQLWKTVFAVAMVAAAVWQIKSELRYGTWQTKVTPTKTLEQMEQEKAAELKYYGSPGFGMESPQVTEQMDRSILPQEMSQFYRNVVSAKDSEDAYRQIQLHRRSNVAIAETDKKHALSSSDAGIDKVDLSLASFNKVTFEVNATADGLITYNQPFDGRWRALLDGEEATVVRANGFENGVFVQKGAHEVTFWYRSATTFGGMIIAFVTLAGLFAVAFFSWLTGKKRVIATLVAAAVLLGFFLLWNSSLYPDAPLSTQYSWTSAQQTNPENMAFGKDTAMSTIRSNQMPYFYYAGFAVDGSRRGATATHPNGARPWWQVDLGKNIPIGNIRIFNRASLTRHLPVRIQVSDDGNSFKTVHVLDAKNLPIGGVALNVNLNGQKGQFVRLWSSQRGPLSLFEVEVYEYQAPPQTTTSAHTDMTDPTGNLRHPVR